MQIAITREVSRTLADAQITYVERQPIDVAKAAAQHEAYCKVLQRYDLTVLRLPALHAMPDAVFVEDAALVLDELAVALVSGAPSRRGETESLVPVLEAFRPVHRLHLPGTLDGGDVVRIDRTLYVGRSTRSNAEGMRQLSEIVEPYGYRVVPVAMQGCLHLKSGCTSLGDRVLINPDFVDLEPFSVHSPITVPALEPEAADVLALEDVIILPDNFPHTAALLERAGYRTETIDVSELQKAEAGVTCMSVIFAAESVPPELASLLL